jgi:hypothetical protein
MRPLPSLPPQGRTFLQGQAWVFLHRFPVTEPVEERTNEEHGVFLRAPAARPVQYRSDIVDRDSPIVDRVAHVAEECMKEFEDRDYG